MMMLLIDTETANSQEGSMELILLYINFRKKDFFWVYSINLKKYIIGILYASDFDYIFLETLAYWLNLTRQHFCYTLNPI